jgi:serine/threonine protein kinase
MGTIGYVSPEQQYGLKVDERTDEYSLAAVCYELLTGRRPLGSFRPPSRLNRRLGRDLDRVVMRGLAEEPKNRYAGVGEFVTAVDHALSASIRRGRLARRVLASAAATLAAVGALALVVGVGPKSRSVERPARIAPPSPGKPQAAGAVAAPVKAKPIAPPAPARERSRQLTRLIELRAYALWVKRGSPTGRAGQAAQLPNWLDAEREVVNQVKLRAYDYWVKQGRPTGPAGEAVSEKNMRAAESALLEETEAEMRRHPIKKQ